MVRIPPSRRGEREASLDTLLTRFDCRQRWCSSHSMTARRCAAAHSEEHKLECNSWAAW